MLESLHYPIKNAQKSLLLNIERQNKFKI
jgi:hypothetical protein